jgi:hypothetical protein
MLRSFYRVVKLMDEARFGRKGTQPVHKSAIRRYVPEVIKYSPPQVAGAVVVGVVIGLLARGRTA